MHVKAITSLLLFSLIYPSIVFGQADEQNWLFKWLFYDYYNTEHHYEDDDNDAYLLKIDLRGEWKFCIGDNNRWKSSEYDDSSWEKINAPADWENEGFHGYDGNAYYRIHFDGSQLEENQTHFLNLGSIDDVDEAYVNGQLVGRSGCFPPEFKTAYKADRKYYIPNSIIDFNGDNVIAVRVYDDVLNGGITRGDLGIYITQKDQYVNQNLYGLWSFSTDNDPDFKERYYKDDQWESLLVPSYWDNQGYRLLDGIAWYRKTFELEFQLESSKSYYLILGKIDDFDVTYLNGKEIGYTNDDLGYGQSRSYDKLRIYEIPSGLLSPKSSNTIAIKVSDIGNDGGIYMGPIGIIEEDNLTKAIRR